jgi:acyl carrier protein
MSRSRTESKLRQIVAQVSGTDQAPESIPLGPGLLDQLHIDSLMALEIIVQIEQEFGVAIEDDDFAIEMLDSLSKAVDYIEQAKQQHSMLLADTTSPRERGDQ